MLFGHLTCRYVGKISTSDPLQTMNNVRKALSIGGLKGGLFLLQPACARKKDTLVSICPRASTAGGILLL
jgi:hypothetical protein